MASKVKKLQVNLEVNAAFESAKKQVEVFKRQLESLNLPKDITKDLSYNLRDYEKTLNKLMTFKPNSANLLNYQGLLENLKVSFSEIIEEIGKLDSKTESYFKGKSTIQTRIEEIENLKKQLKQLEKETKKYYGVTDLDSQEKRKAAIAKKEKISSSLSGAAQEASLQKQKKMKDALKESENIRKRIINLEEQLEEATKKESAAQEEAAEKIKKVTTAVEDLNPPVKEGEKNFEELKNELAELNANEATEALNSVVKRWTEIGVAVQFARTQLTQMKETYLELDASLTQIAVVSGKTRSQMWDMIGSYNEMAQRLGTTTSQVVEASKLYYQQGRTQTEVMELVEQTSILAAISELDFADATNYLTAAVNGFNLEAEDASNITDVWANLAAKAAVDTNELATAISKVASIAKSAGTSIETTSAFLTKMIETTREAPENLGTALKTVIARFQELSDSTEELEDGVDANKVEKALKTADVALRDTTGQFRDFDDVIMELSSKWDGLDRNTQRYIATIAAGSRQQSRFIALVEDYERNLELIEMAENSSGAAAAQFNTQLTGLQASINRLTAAWEELYTSVNGSQVFSFLIDTLATLISSFGDLGLGITSISTIAIFSFAKIAASSAAYSASFIKDRTTEITVTALAKKGFEAYWAGVKKATASMLPYAASLAAIVASIAVFTAALYGLNYVLNGTKLQLEKSKKALQEYEGQLGATKQEISTLQSLQKELDEANEKHQDLSDIRTKILDQAPEIANRINVETASYHELTNALKEYTKEKQKEAALDAIKTARANYDVAVKERNKISQDLLILKQSMEDLPRKAGFKLTTGEIISKEQYEAIQKSGSEEKIATLQGAIEFSNLYYYNGKYYETFEDFIGDYNSDIKNQLDQVNKDLEENYKISYSYLKTYATDKTNALGLSNIENAEDVVSLMLYGLTIDDIDEETGKITKEIAGLNRESILKILNETEKIFATSKSGDSLQEAWNNMLKGDFSSLSEDLISEFFIEGIDLKRIFPEFMSEFNDRRNELASAFKDLGLEIGRDMSNSFLEQWYNTISNSEGTQQDLYKSIFNAIADPVLLSSLSEEDRAIVQQTTTDIDDLINTFGVLEGTIFPAGKALRESIIAAIAESGESAENASKQVDDYASTLDSLAKVLASGEGVNFDDLTMMMAEYGLSAADVDYDALTNTWHLTEEAILRVAEAKRQETITTLENTLAAEQSNLTKLEEERRSLELAIAFNNNSQSAVTLGKAHIGAAYAARELNLQLGNLTPEVDASSFSLLENAEQTTGLTAKLEEQLQEVKNNISSTKERITVTEEMLDGIKNTTVAEQLAARTTSDSSSATNDAADAAKNYADALKEQAEALREAAEAEQQRIETEIEAIKKVLEKKKEALEEQNEMLQEQIDKEKEAQEILLEGYLKYLEKRQNEYQESLDALEKAAEEAREKADQSNEDLTFTNQIAQDYYQNQIDLIDEKINALNEEAEAEDRLQKLQEARDAYERAKNTKNRLVLVAGAGWVLKRDQTEINSTYDALQDAEREVEIAKLNEEKELLEEQKNLWAEKAENIGKTTEELEKYNKAYAEFSEMTEEQRKEALDAFIDAIIKNNELNQDVSDKEDIFEEQSDPDKEGSLAWNIEKIEELTDKTNDLLDSIDKSFEELLKDEKINAVVDSLDKLLGDKGIEGLDNYLKTLTDGVNSYLDTFINLSNQINSNEESIEKIDEALEDWEELTENLGKSQSELNKELELFNYYNQKSLEQLSKSGEIYKNLTIQISQLADQWERVNAAQAAYEAAEAEANRISAAKEGYATGGVNTYTGLAAVHGTKSKPELVLNNSQASALFNFIDGLTKKVTLIKRQNLPRSINSTTTNEDNSVNYNNCKFEVTTNQNNINDLLQEVRNRSPLRKF